MVVTFIGIYAALFELSGVQVGLIAVAYSLTQLVVLFPIGRYADLGNRKRIFLGGLLLSIPTYFLFWQATGFRILLIARLLQGIAYPMVAIAALSFIGLQSSKTNRGRNLGLFQMLRAGGRAFGAIAGGYLVGRFGFGAPYGMVIVLYVLSSLLIYKLICEVPKGGEGEDSFALRDLFDKANFRIQMTFETAFAFAKAIVITFIPVYVHAILGFSEIQLGLIVGVRYIPMVLGQIFTGRLSDRIGRKPLILGGGSLFLLSTILLPWQSTFWSLVGISILIGLADTIRVPASWAVFADEGVGVASATSFSFRMIAWRPGLLLGPILGGLVKDLMGITCTFYLAGFAVFAALSCYIGMRARSISE